MTLPALTLAAACVALGNGDRVTAGDLAKAAPAWSAVAADTVLGYAPAPGVRRVFGTGELERLAVRQGIRLESAGPVCVEHPMSALDPERLLAALRKSLGMPEAALEIVDYSRYPAPRGELEFPRAGLSEQRAPLLWKGYVRYAAGRRFAIWARVKIAVRIERVLAAQSLAAGKPVEAAALRVETYEGLPPRETAAGSPEQVVGRVPRRLIPAGSPVWLSLLEAPPEVTRGTTVRVQVVSGAARLELEARAEANGRRGETIPVRNPASGKRFTARVEEKGKVVVSR